MMLENRVILVTGSTTGIGEATARRCAAEGASVVVHGRDEARARQVADDVGGAYVVGDLGDPEVPAALVEAAVTRYGRIDGLVNNAALTTRTDLASTSAEAFDRIIGVNLRAPLLAIRAAMPHFQRQGGGAVVNVGSINAYCGARNLLAYSISKGGMATMTRNLADAHATDRVRINQINVGWTLSENERQLKLDEGLPPGWEHQIPAVHAPFGRIFSPEEVAGHIVFWLSDLAGPATGSVFEIEQFPMIGRNTNT